MSEVEFIQGKNKKTLTDASILEKYADIAKNVEKFAVANRIGQVLDDFINGEEKDERMFNLLHEVFCKLNDRNLKMAKYEAVFHYFLWNALFLLGYLPEIDTCNICGEGINPYTIYFSNKEGGVICKKCAPQDADAQKINSDVIKILRLILKKEWQIIVNLKVGLASQKLFKKISEKYYLYVLSGHSFKNVLRTGAEVI